MLFYMGYLSVHGFGYHWVTLKPPWIQRDDCISKTGLHFHYASHLSCLYISVIYVLVFEMGICLPRLVSNSAEVILLPPPPE
jgi:hypothetical protein